MPTDLIEKDMTLTQKQPYKLSVPRRPVCVPAPVTATLLATLLLSGLTGGAQAQQTENSRVSPQVRNFLRENAVGANGRFVPRFRSQSRPMVPLRQNRQQQLPLSPRRAAALRNRTKANLASTVRTDLAMKALAQRDRMPAARLRGKFGSPMAPIVATRAAGRNIATAFNEKWQNVGPTNLLNTTTFLTPTRLLMGETPVAGRVNAATFDPTGSNFYVATAGGGVWRFRLNPNFDPNNVGFPDNPRLLVSNNPSNPSPVQLSDSLFPSLQTSSITFDPRNSNTFYVGMGDYPTGGQETVVQPNPGTNRASNNIRYSAGIMKTVNGGRTWVNIGNSTLVPPIRMTMAAAPAPTTTTFSAASNAFLDGDGTPDGFAQRNGELINGTVRIVSVPSADPNLQALVGQVRRITGYVVVVPNTNPAQQRVFTVETAFTATPPAGTEFEVTIPPILEGTAVPGIVVYPEDTRRIIAISGRGVDPNNIGSLWVSRNGGNTFRRANLIGAGGPLVPFGNWSSIDYTLRGGANNSRVLFATREGDGVYRSTDLGDSWERIPNVPLVFNVPNPGGNPEEELGLGLKVATSKRNRNTVYVFEGSDGFDDGNAFKSLNATAASPGWINITGDFPRGEGEGNEFEFSAYSLFLNTGSVNVSILDENFQVTGRTNSQEALFTGLFGLSSSLGAVNERGVLSSSSETGDAVRRDDLGAGRDWEPIGGRFETGDLRTHAFQKGLVFDPRVSTLSFLVNDGGVYPLVYQPGNLVLPFNFGQLPQFFGNPSWDFTVFNSNVDPNSQFPIGEFYTADFQEITSAPASQPGRNRILVVGSMASNSAVRGVIDYTGTTSANPEPVTTWSSIAELDDTALAIANVVPDIPVPGRVETDGSPVVDPDDVRGLVWFSPFLLDIEVDTVAIDPNDPTGNTQYLVTYGEPGVPWGNRNGIGGSYKAVFYTTDNWTTYQDITPDLYAVDGDTEDIFVYNTLSPQDTTTPGNWGGETRPHFGMPIAFGFAPRVRQVIPNDADDLPDDSTGLNLPGAVLGPADQPCMYTGGQYLWRFDPPGSLAKALLPGPVGRTADPTPGTPPNPPVDDPFSVEERLWPNIDRGVWRRVSGTQLATGDATISAIAIDRNFPNRIYVGTTAGDVWFIGSVTAPTSPVAGALRLNPEQVEGNAVPDIQPLETAIRHIAGPGVTGNTLPARPVTSITINTDPAATQLGDIVVTLSGAPGTARVWRCTNVTGVGPTGTPIFTAASGQGFAALPDVPVNSLVRDPDDPTNTFYAATDLGVYTTIDGGTTWQNATSPLGLPNVECTSIKVIPDTPGNLLPASPPPQRTLMVATMGRGIWRFNMNELQTTNAGPNLKISQNYSRVAGELIVNVIITNQNTGLPAGQTVGTAFDVRLTSATLTVGATTTPTNSFPTGGSINVGTIAPGQTQIVTVRFPGSAGRAGSAAIFRSRVDYTLPPFPPGTPANATNGAGARTRLP